jgi:curli biogenesis system outer membrane secretion channel CsgG
MFMNSYRAKLLVAAAVAACLACAAQAQPITKAVQAACKDDYKQFCGEYGLETSGLRSCMDRNGHNLSKMCVNALVQAGEVSQAEVDRRKRASR